ncbi:YczE/YyaS/YitT family protein [Enterococcus columbae]|uniref:Tat pathway signal sequence n=1 Tax=Enterococcus columbae DSM 7374 = ATCC 51263 TaxID=1121865 RepID=S1N2S7_9ENTE|nr:hypothetical protein [Enterococcus columbae]EOT39179.1 hypothetical protein OMW_02056 [Enterococcus columbae DSM 7374 = ATCC 51263]EOW79888.1 hypothetical protein I568_02239 [Enterococcus columbae DSM 7374 = ATCC 51263]OJG24509.1 hypothetical protein RR47_GL000232 [Enterococcus columbae DSM 7374 = ATCC 51263]
MMMQEKVRRIFMSIVGVIVTGFCVGGLQKANLGVDPFTCFVTGIANLLHSTYSVFYLVITAMLLLFVLLIRRHYIGLATLLNLLLTGVSADFSYQVIDKIIHQPTFIVRVVLMIGSIIVMCFSASLYFTADLGVSGYDAVALILANKFTCVPFRYWRILTDGFCVLVGFTFAVNIGLGTVITAFFMGPFIQFFTIHIAEPFRYQNKQILSN